MALRGKVASDLFLGHLQNRSNGSIGGEGTLGLCLVGHENVCVRTTEVTVCADDLEGEAGLDPEAEDGAKSDEAQNGDRRNNPRHDGNLDVVRFPSLAWRFFRRELPLSGLVRLKRIVYLSSLRHFFAVFQSRSCFSSWSQCCSPLRDVFTMSTGLRLNAASSSVALLCKISLSALRSSNGDGVVF